MLLTSDLACRRLRRLLSQRYQACKSLTDADVLAASRRLDVLVVQMMRGQASPPQRVAQGPSS